MSNMTKLLQPVFGQGLPWIGGGLFLFADDSQMPA